MKKKIIFLSLIMLTFSLVMTIGNVNAKEMSLKIGIMPAVDSAPILVSKDFKEKEEVKIGMMEVSVTNFLAEEFLKDKYKLNKIFIPAIPARLEMLKSGQLEMAVIPEPLASTAELQGLEKRKYKNDYDYMPEAMIFTETALNKKDEEISIFHKVYNKAVKEINEDDSEARKILIKSLDLPIKIKDLILMPDYNLTRIPSEDYLNKVIKWVEKTNNSKININYNQAVEGKYSSQ